jgi:hypothetical protein
MKWGIRRTPEQLGHRKQGLKKSIIFDIIKTGRVSVKVNRENQNRHIPSSTGYIKGRSQLFGSLDDAQKLINELSGTGKPIIINGKWKHKERVSASKVIGVYINPETGEAKRTNKAIIVYSKTGSHIYPRKPKKGE